MPIQSVDLAEKLAQFNDHWAPRTVAEFNGHDVMVVKFQGEYAWHTHADTDDFFLVIAGQVLLDLKIAGTQDVSTVTLNAGQLYIVPQGVEHRPRAAQEAQVLLMERTGTPNSGDPATAAPRRVV